MLYYSRAPVHSSSPGNRRAFRRSTGVSYLAALMTQSSPHMSTDTSLEMPKVRVYSQQKAIHPANCQSGLSVTALQSCTLQGKNLSMYHSTMARLFLRLIGTTAMPSLTSCILGNRHLALAPPKLEPWPISSIQSAESRWFMTFRRTMGKSAQTSLTTKPNGSSRTAVQSTRLESLTKLRKF